MQLSISSKELTPYILGTVFLLQTVFKDALFLGNTLFCQDERIDTTLIRCVKLSKLRLETVNLALSKYYILFVCRQFLS